LERFGILGAKNEAVLVESKPRKLIDIYGLFPVMLRLTSSQDFACYFIAGPNRMTVQPRLKALTADAQAMTEMNANELKRAA
jgi:hypothetical protein